ncbi:GDSL esterase/lipase At1g33811 [Nymphaea colorata]|nr:GDSL esterase/lipase At1g33811 [Nymphaea colorata]
MGFAVAALVAIRLALLAGARPEPQVPCLFIFGDSLVDNGNNNGLLTLSRANYMPYGVDFPQGVTGRFTNGRTTVDIIAQLLGFRRFIPAYATARTQDLVVGANYASGASGIRDETGMNLGDHVSMNQQVQNFARTARRLTRLFGGNSSYAGEYLSRCIFHVGMGSNDYLNNYFMTNVYDTSTRYTTRSYAASLIRDYSAQLTRLYDLGARKVVVTAIGQIGCIPYELSRLSRNGSECVGNINRAVQMFNAGLRNLVTRFNRRLPDACFVFFNSYFAFQDLLDNSGYYGFSVTDRGCCGVGRNNGQLTCLPFQQPCEDRESYLFWDAFHPTEAANVILARKSYSSPSANEVYPMNIQQLARS